ncbi:unnamed protein product [Cunninghamella blakesleeana]
MTLKTSSLIMDKRISRSSFAWLTPSPKEERHRSASFSSNTTPSPTTSSSRKFGFFSKFKSSTTDLSQHQNHGLSTSDDDDDDEEEKIPPTPRDSLTHPPTSAPTSMKPTIITDPTFLNPQTLYHPPPLSSSPPPLPPQHATLYQSVREVLSNTFNDIDKIIENEWESSRQQLQINIHTTPTYQFS